MSFWIGFHGFVKGFVDKRVIIVLTEYVGDDTPVTKVKDGTEIEFVYGNALVPLELRHIGQPFFIGFVRIKLAVQDILRNVLGILGLPGTAAAGVLDGRLDIPGPADAQHTLIVHMDTVVVAQIIIEPAVTLIRAFLVALFYDTGQTFIFRCPAARFPRNPLVVGGSRHMEQGAGIFNRIPLFLMAFLDGSVNPPLSYS